MDDLSARVDRGFEKVDRGLRDLRAGQEAIRNEVKAGDDSLRDQMNLRFGEMNARFDRVEQAIRWFGGIMLAAFVTAYLSGAF